MKEDTLIVEKDGMYAFRDYENNLNIPKEMVEKLKKEMNYEEAIMCFVNSLIDVQHKSEEIERLQNIIKEVREWANKTVFYFDFEEEINKHAFDLLYTKQGQELLEILDKGE